jgi:hypothetical protein
MYVIFVFFLYIYIHTYPGGSVEVKEFKHRMDRTEKPNIFPADSVTQATGHPMDRPGPRKIPRAAKNEQDQ